MHGTHLCLLRHWDHNVTKDPREGAMFSTPYSRRFRMGWAQAWCPLGRSRVLVGNFTVEVLGLTTGVVMICYAAAAACCWGLLG